MAIEKTKLRVMNKLFDNGYITEKSIISFGVQDIQKTKLNSPDELSCFLKLQEAVKRNKIISYLAGNEAPNEVLDKY